MNYRYLEAFQAVGSRLSFTDAAKSLSISTAAVSRQIKLLEEELGRQLLIRSPKKVVLTKDGKHLLSNLNSFSSNMKAYFDADSIREIRVGIIQPLLENWFLHFIEKHSSKSSVNFKITHASPSKITSLLENGDLDVGLYNKNIQTDHLTSIKLMKECPILISKNKLDFKDVSKERWITCEDKDYIINYAYKKKIKKSNRITQVNSPSTQVKLVESGYGIAMISSLMIPSKSKLHRLEIDLFKNEYFYLVMPTTDIIAPHLEAFKNDILNAID